MTYRIVNDKGTLRVKDGRKTLAKVSGSTLSATVLDGIAAGSDPELAIEAQIAALEAAVALALTRKASVIPDHYRHQYGVDQSCGDAIAKTLTAATTKVDGKKTSTDLDAARAIAVTNGVEDRFDTWVSKQLNPGMVRMNLGNVLRGMARRGDEVRIGDKMFVEGND